MNQFKAKSKAGNHQDNDLKDLDDLVMQLIFHTNTMIEKTNYKQMISQAVEKQDTHAQ